MFEVEIKQLDEIFYIFKFFQRQAMLWQADVLNEDDTKHWNIDWEFTGTVVVPVSQQATSNPVSPVHLVVTSTSIKARESHQSTAQ